MKFSEVVTQTLTWLQREGRVSYRALKREFELDDDFVEDIKEELIAVKELAVDKDGKMLVWVGEGGQGETGQRGNGEAEKVSSQPLAPSIQHPEAPRSTLHAPRAEAERRQLTVMFCDLVGSTALSARLDPEDLREVVRAYQQTCATVIHRHEGHIAQYLGDGLLVYFGYPTAHEDDARRAVRAGLEIVEAIRGQVTGDGGQVRRQPLQVRIGMHTGLVVIGDIGTRDRTEQLALGETPNIAARIQGLAEPNTILISAATQRLVDGQFESQPFGSHLVKGIDTPIAVYHVQSERQTGGQLENKTTLTPLVGRDQEVGLLFDRWEQVKEGRGQVVLLSGEPGIGKSRLAYTLREHITSEGSLLFEARCSPYHQHSVLYPLIDVLQRTLLLTRQDTDEEKVAKLDRALTLYGIQEALPLFTALLSLPTLSQYPPLALTPRKQKERTLQALVQLWVAQAERQATVSVWEDLHWADPSSLEFLTLLVEQVPTTKLLVVLTFRPEFTPPWKLRSHISQLVINRLGKKQVETMIEQAAGGNSLPPEIIEQIRVKTDGVPLFVEELTKSVIESVGSVESIGSGGLPRQLAIPATLQEALLARLDRLSTARQIAQLGATLGREFSYELLHAVASTSEADLQSALSKLVEAEILYQRGTGEQTRYFFKHALIQDTAYQSLLKSTRQQYHQQIAHILVERFPQTKETQPELLAHHYTEANLIEQAIPYWQQAGQKATERSANAEAVSHLTRGLELLETFPETQERAQQELTLQVALGTSLGVLKGYTTAEVEHVYLRAKDLCQHVGETSQLAPVLFGLWVFHLMRAEYQPARELGEQLLRIAQNMQDSALLVVGHYALGEVLLRVGEFALTREHLEQGVNFYDIQQHRSLASLYAGYDPAVACLSLASMPLWLFGYPDQALLRSQEALTLANELAHPISRVFALNAAGWLHLYRREGIAAEQQAAAEIALSAEQESPYWGILEGTILQGWALAEQGQMEEGIAQIREGSSGYRTLGGELGQPHYLGLLAEAYGKAGQAGEGLATLAEALATVDKTGECASEAELYRLRGELTLQRFRVSSFEFLLAPSPHAEAEACFLKALEIAQKQQAKSWELRASTSLARLWQQQGKTAEAHKLLSDVYNWFTEGFDTRDLQEAKTLLEGVSRTLD